MTNFCSEMTSLTRSPMEIRPISLPPSKTGRWRSRFSVISTMHSSLVWSGRTYMTVDVMMSRTEVSFDDRAMRTIFRVVTFGNDADDCLALHDQERANVLFRHQFDGVEHRRRGCDGV